MQQNINAAENNKILINFNIDVVERKSVTLADQIYIPISSNNMTSKVKTGKK